ncbi:MAG: thiamine-phosphate kinase [Planctomycetota bacterium]
MSWSEGRLHDWLARTAVAARGVASAFGSDAVTFEPTTGRWVTCCDQTIEGVHYAPEVSPVAAGRKAAARALSDLAATAAEPRALLLALTLPAAAEESAIRAGIDAVRERARDFGAELVGGDLAAAGSTWRWSVTALGVQPATRPPIGRHGARAGDVVVLTGPTGGAQLGRHLELEPRFAAGEFLFRAGAHAMMDTSDGTAMDLERLARASGVAFELDVVPVHRDAERAAGASGHPAWHHALVDGEDHELLATLSAEAWDAIRTEAATRFPDLSAIGRAAPGEGCHWTSPEGTRLRLADLGGWLHG